LSLLASTRGPASPDVRERGSWPVSYLWAAILVVLAEPAFAIAKYSIGPPRSELRLEAGSETTLVLDVVNHGDESLRLKVYAADFEIDSDGRAQFPKGSGAARSCAEWLRFNPQTLEIDSSASSPVRATARVPRETPSGTYWCAILVEDVPPPPTKGQKKTVFGMELKARLASLVYLDVGETGEKGVRIESLRAETKGGKLEATGEVSHSSGGYLRLVGAWDLVSADGTVAKSESINVPLLPAHRQRLRLSTDAGPGKYTVRLSLDFAGAKRVTAETNVTVPSGSLD
jgi:hypothetical protein